MHASHLRIFGFFLLLSACRPADGGIDAGPEVGLSDASEADARPAARLEPVSSAAIPEAPPSGPETNAAIEQEVALPAMPVELSSTMMEYEDEPAQEVLVAEGLPAISANGRYVIDRSRGDDYGNSDLLVIHATSGRVVHRRPWPQSFDGGEGTAGPISWNQVHSLRRYLALHEFTSIVPLSFVERDDGTGRQLVFGAGDLEVIARTLPTETDTHVTAIRKGEMVFEHIYADSEIMAASVSADETLLVLQVGFCGCHCRSEPVVVRLP